MDSELQHDETVDDDHDELHRLRSQLVAVHAVVGVGNLTIAPAVKPPPTRSECF